MSRKSQTKSPWNNLSWYPVSSSLTSKFRTWRLNIQSFIGSNLLALALFVSPGFWDTVYILCFESVNNETCMYTKSNICVISPLLTTWNRYVTHHMTCFRCVLSRKTRFHYNTLRPRVVNSWCIAVINLPVDDSAVSSALIDLPEIMHMQ